MIAAAVGASALALIELDAASVGPFLFSRPFVVGPLVGWALGDAWTGAAFGAIFEALTLEQLPLGGSMRLSAPIAAGASAWLAIGPGALPAEAAFLAGLAAGWAHGRFERAFRRGRSARARRVEEALRSGRPPRLGAEIFAALASQVAATFGLLLAIFAAVGPVLALIWPTLPAVLRDGARTAFLCAPWIGAGSLAASLWRRF